MFGKAELLLVEGGVGFEPLLLLLFELELLLLLGGKVDGLVGIVGKIAIEIKLKVKAFPLLNSAVAL